MRSGCDLGDAFSCWMPPLAFECSTGWFVHGWHDHGIFTLLQGILTIILTVIISFHDDGGEEDGGECFSIEV